MCLNLKPANVIDMAGLLAFHCLWLLTCTPLPLAAGEARETVGRWARGNLESRGAQKLSSAVRHHIRNWYSSLMVSAGAQVDWKDDVVALSKKGTSLQ